MKNESRGAHPLMKGVIEEPRMMRESSKLEVEMKEPLMLNIKSIEDQFELKNEVEVDFKSLMNGSMISSESLYLFGFIKSFISSSDPH